MNSVDPFSTKMYFLRDENWNVISGKGSWLTMFFVLLVGFFFNFFCFCFSFVTANSCLYLFLIFFMGPLEFLSLKYGFIQWWDHLWLLVSFQKLYPCNSLHSGPTCWKPQFHSCFNSLMHGPYLLGVSPSCMKCLLLSGATYFLPPYFWIVL